MDALIQTLEDDVRAVQAQAYLGTAGFCLIVYDILITWDIEVTLVWPASFSFVKFLFLWNRYVTPGLYIWVVYMLSGQVTSVPDDSYCFAFFLVSLMLQAICANCVGATLMLMRVYALYNRDKRVLAVLVTLLVFELGMTFGLSVYGSFHNRAQMLFIPLLGTCALTDHLSWLWVVFLSMIFFDITIFFLVLWKTWQHVRLTQVQTSLMSALLLDGVWYFLVMIATEFLNLVAFATFSSSLFLVGMNIGWCLNTMMVSRIYLNLRKTARPQDWTELTAFKTPGRSQSLDAAGYHSGRRGVASEEDPMNLEGA